MTTRQLFIICYDIHSNRKRTKISEILEQYGKRVNYSVFECFLTIQQLNKISMKISELTNLKTDLIKIYPVCKSCFGKSYTIGNEEHIQHSHTLFIT